MSPIYAIVAVWLVSSAVVLVLEKLELITSISATAGYIGYCGIIYASFKAPRDRSLFEGFQLRGWRVPIATLALVWTVVVVGALTVPTIDGGRLAAWTTLSGISVGILIYFALIRRRISRGEAGPPVTADGDE